VQEKINRHMPNGGSYTPQNIIFPLTPVFGQRLPSVFYQSKPKNDQLCSGAFGAARFSPEEVK
jgi:hypothetical protein